MALWVLDTDSLSLFQRGHPALLPRIQALPGTQIAISIVSVQEMPQGRLAQIRRAGSGEDRVRAGAERPLAAEEGGRGHIGRMSPYCGNSVKSGPRGVPARQTGWMSRFGERLAIPLAGDEEEAICPHTGDLYRLEGGRVHMEPAPRLR